MLTILAALLWGGAAIAGEAPPPTFVEIIVTACPEAAEARNRPEAVMGYYHEPEGQGDVPGDHRATSGAERKAYLTKLGCIDVPIPPEVVQGNTEMSMDVCKGPGGYLASMQYLAQNATISQKAVGAWLCVPHLTMPTGVASF